MEIGELTVEKAEIIENKNFRLCPRCRPALHTDGVFHACSFAVESNEPHFHLGQLGKDAGETVLENYQKFLDWIDTTLEPEAERLGIHPCQVCTYKLDTLPTFRETSAAEKIEAP